ncbi:thiamine diphosphate-binding protein, partial [Vararia minispora EC-137]
GWEQKFKLPTYTPADAAQASRRLSEIVLTAITPVLPDLIGGSADLTGSNLTRVKGVTDFQPPSAGLGIYTGALRSLPQLHAGTYIRYGVREHGMDAIANGLAACGGVVPFIATFLNFVAYAAGAVRLSTLSGHQLIWVGE